MMQSVMCVCKPLLYGAIAGAASAMGWVIVDLVWFHHLLSGAAR